MASKNMKTKTLSVYPVTATTPAAMATSSAICASATIPSQRRHRKRTAKTRETRYVASTRP